jgi:hypothetical protein
MDSEQSLVITTPQILHFKTLRQNLKSPKRLLEPISHSMQSNRVQKKHKSEIEASREIEDLLQIKIFDAETHSCVLCLLKLKFKQIDQLCKNGCEIPNNDEELKYTLSLFRNLEIVVEWHKTDY